MASPDSPLGGLDGRRAVVTGGAGDIGLAIVRQLTELGAKVAVFDLDLAKLESSGVAMDAVGIKVDVSDPERVAAAFAEAERALGGIDLLIANAGISLRTAALDISAAEWKRVLGVNLSGVFYCAQEAGRRMRDGDGGTILMTASTNGLKAHANYAHYNASKAGVIALAKTFALELAPKVRVNAICPGYVDTAMQAAEYTPEMLAAVNAGLPLGRHATPQEVARLFAYLASDWGSYVTGQALVIDGGELA